MIKFVRAGLSSAIDCAMRAITNNRRRGVALCHAAKINPSILGTTMRLVTDASRLGDLV